jgi:carbonic anhydrase
MISAHEALGRLREGNRRFVSNVGGTDRVLSSVRHAQLPQTQESFAVVLSCSDSRVPPEAVFDQGPGNLFVIRVTGNIVAASQVGSVEFAAERFGARLVVVLGHTRCGAVYLTFEALQKRTKSQSPNL